MTYVFGVIGMLIAAAAALRGKTEPKVSAVPGAGTGTDHGQRPGRGGGSAARCGHLITEYDDRIRFSRVRHNRVVSIATDDFAPIPGRHRLGDRSAGLVDEVAARLGHVSTLHLELDRGPGLPADRGVQPRASPAGP